jgi:hypothetical protein
MLAGSTIASIIISGNRLEDGFSLGAAAAWPGRDSRRVESCDGSSSFFIVRSFPSALDVRDRYYDLC